MTVHAVAYEHVTEEDYEAIRRMLTKWDTDDYLDNYALDVAKWEWLVLDDDPSIFSASTPYFDGDIPHLTPVFHQDSASFIAEIFKLSLER